MWSRGTVPAVQNPFVALAGLALVVASCASQGGPVAAERATTTAPILNTTTTPEKSKETTTTSELPSSFPIGTKVTTSAGNFFTLHGYEQPTPGDGFWEPDPGNEFAAVDVEFCRGAKPEASYLTGIGPSDFELQMGDNTRRTGDISVKEPALHYTEVPSIGDCVRGWITYQVPVGIRPKYLVVENTNPLVKFEL